MNTNTLTHTHSPGGADAPGGIRAAARPTPPLNPLNPLPAQTHLTPNPSPLSPAYPPYPSNIGPHPIDTFCLALAAASDDPHSLCDQFDFDLQTLEAWLDHPRVHDYFNLQSKYAAARATLHAHAHASAAVATLARTLHSKSPTLALQAAHSILSLATHTHSPSPSPSPSSSAPSSESSVDKNNLRALPPPSSLRDSVVGVAVTALRSLRPSCTCVASSLRDSVVVVVVGVVVTALHSLRHSLITPLSSLKSQISNPLIPPSSSASSESSVDKNNLRALPPPSSLRDSVVGVVGVVAHSLRPSSFALRHSLLLLLTFTLLLASGTIPLPKPHASLTSNRAEPPMKIALDWIADYLSRPLNPAEAENALINAGLPLESNTPTATTHVLDVEVTSNRSDCLSHIGLARELAALLPNVSFQPPTFAARPTGTDIRAKTKIRVDDTSACTYYSARLIENVKVAPSPDWLVRRLESVGIRPVNNVVDITNYVLMETGQPLHAFDFNALAGKEIIVRAAAPGEKILAIDGKTYTLSPTQLVIADAQKPVAVAGVMGGKESEVSPTSTTILLESARFDPTVIRAQARALALHSDSSFRFERGIDPAAAEHASLRAAQLIHELAGGIISAGVITVGKINAAQRTVQMRTGRVKTILGYDIPADAMRDILARLGFLPEAAGPVITCTIPSHRLDIDREIDLIEEIARVHGYDKIPLYAQITHGVQPEPTREKARRVILDTLTAAAFTEAITVTFVEDAQAQRFLPSADATAVRVSDNLRGATNVLRPSLLPSLLAVRRTNQNAGNPSACVFEHAATIWQKKAQRHEATQAPSAGDSLCASVPECLSASPVEEKKLALVGNSVSQIRGALEALAYKLSADAAITVEPANFPWYVSGIAGHVILTLAGKSSRIGHLGLCAAGIQKMFDLRHEVAAAELSWEPLLAAFEPVRRAKPLPKYPGIRRDLSVVVEDKIRWVDIQSTLDGAHLPHIESIDFVGIFRNKQIGPGKKSLTLTLEFRDPAATLRSEQVDTQMASALTLLTQKHQATLRQ